MITIDRTNAATTYSPILYPYDWTQVYDTFNVFDWSIGNNTCCGSDPSATVQLTWTASTLKVDGTITFDPSCTNTLKTSLTISQTNVSGNAFFTTNNLSIVLYQHNNSLALSSSVYPCLWIFSNAVSVPTAEIDYTIPMTQTWNFIGSVPDIAVASIVTDPTILTSKSSSTFKAQLKSYPCCMPDPTQPITLAPNQTIGVAPGTSAFTVPFPPSAACTSVGISPQLLSMNETMLGGASNNTLFGSIFNVFYYPYNLTLAVSYQGCMTYYISSSPPNLPLQTCNCTPPYALISHSRINSVGYVFIFLVIISSIFMT